MHFNIGLEVALQVLNCKWKFLIINELLQGPKRFCELKKTINGISQKVFVSNLKELEKSGLILRKEYNEQRIKVEYALTVLGYSIKPVLDYMSEWGKNYLQK